MVPKQQHSKLDAVSQPGWLVGYAQYGGTKGWRVWVFNVGKVVVRRDVKFDEGVNMHGGNLEEGQRSTDPRNDAAPPTWGAAKPAGSSVEESADNFSSAAGSEAVKPEDSAHAAQLPAFPAQAAPEHRYPQCERRVPAHLPQPATAPVPAPAPERRYPTRKWHPPAHHAHLAAINMDLTAFCSTGDPSDFAEAMSRPDAQRWKKAMDEEMESQHSNSTWVLAVTPPGVRGYSG